MTAPRVDVAELVDSGRLNPLQWRIVLMAVLILWVDGTDFAAANVAAPDIIRALHTDRAAMGMVFGAGNFGILVGSLFFGYVGDMYGRKLGAIAGVLAYSTPAFLIMFAGSVHDMVVLRFLAGLGIGGVIPNVIALLNECAPRRMRATLVSLGFVGYGLGSFTSAQVVAHLSPHFGWQTPFVLAGAMGLVLACILAFTLPESVRFLTMRAPDSARTRAMVAAIAPDRKFPADTRFFIAVPKAQKIAIADLFKQQRRLVTPLLWACYFADSLTYMTLISWFTTLLTDAGLAQSGAASAYSWGALAAIVGLVAVARPLDWFGPFATAATAACGMLCILALAWGALPLAAFVPVAIGAYTMCNITHNSLNAIVGTFYPTSMRAKGVGWATGLGRMALVAGPLITGFLLAAHLPMPDVLALIAAPYVVVIATSCVLGLFWRDRAAAGHLATAQEA